MQKLKLLLVTLLLLPLAGYSAEEYYTWVDENGVVNYAEREPTGFNARHVTPGHRAFGHRQTQTREPSTTPTAPAGATSGSSANAGFDPDSVVADELESEQAKLADIKRRNCDIGKKNLIQLQTYSRIRACHDRC
jgi:hypothetical protein